MCYYYFQIRKLKQKIKQSFKINKKPSFDESDTRARQIQLKLKYL